MTCFWTGIIKNLDKDDFKKLGLGEKPDVHELIHTLKGLNKRENSVHWNGNLLTEKQKEENFQHVKDYDPKSAKKGYLCGTCDPFLILLSELLNIDIEHTFLGKLIHYKNGGQKTYFFGSNHNHFYKK